MVELKISLGQNSRGSIILNRFSDELPKNIRKGLNAAGSELLLSMRRKISGDGFVKNPARSSPYPGVFAGEMLRTTFSKPDPDGYAIRVGPNVDYAKYHEFGTSRMPARPFIWPTWEDTGDKALNKLQAIIMEPLK